MRPVHPADVFFLEAFFLALIAAALPGPLSLLATVACTLVLVYFVVSLTK